MKRKHKRNKITIKDWDDLRKELIKQLKKDAKKHKKLFQYCAYMYNPKEPYLFNFDTTDIWKPVPIKDVFKGID